MSEKITIQDGIKDEYSKFCKDNKVSPQGLTSALLLIVMGKTDELGECHVNWKKLRKMYPPRDFINDKRWERVVKAVEIMLDDMGIMDLTSLEPRDIIEMAARSKYTMAQIKRVIEDKIDD